MRAVVAVIAAALAALAAVVSSISGETDVIVFFVVLAGGATVIAALASGPWTRPAWPLARALAVGWVGTAAWIAVLLVWYQASCACSSPAPPAVPPNVAGISTTAFHLLATYLGGALVAVAAFSDRLGPAASWSRASLIPKWWAIS